MLENTKTLFGQPRGLYVIVMADLWGRFGYAGMKAILIYYLTQTLSISQSRTSLLFGTFTSLLLMMPLPCGIIADRYLGRRRSVLMGAGLMCVGNLMLVFPALIYPALAMLAFGTGLFQSCLPSQVMSLYKNDEAGAAIGFNYYYIGLNIGALLGGICCGAIGEYYGWKWGFALASLGMLPAMTSFMIGRKYLSEEPVPTRDKMASGRNSIKFNNINVPVFIGFIVALILLVMTYEQMFNSVAFWIAQNVDRNVGFYRIPMTWFPAINPLVVILIGPLLGLMWRRWPNGGDAKSLCGRVAIGATIIGVAYAFLSAISFLVSGSQVNWIPPVLFMIIMTIGEIFVMPASLSLFGRLAPPQAAAGFFGIWFVANATGNFLAGLLSSRWTMMNHALFFFLAAMIAILAAILFLTVRNASLFLAGSVPPHGDAGPCLS